MGLWCSGCQRFVNEECRWVWCPLAHGEGKEAQLLVKQWPVAHLLNIVNTRQFGFVLAQLLVNWVLYGQSKAGEPCGLGPATYPAKATRTPAARYSGRTTGSATTWHGSATTTSAGGARPLPIQLRDSQKFFLQTAPAACCGVGWR